MAIDFPNTPTTNQIYTVGSRSWKWDGTIWAIYSNNPVLYRQDSPPSSPQEGDQWFETDTGRMFVYYGTAWVELGNATDVAGALQPSQVTALSAVTTLTSDDVFPVVDGPSGAIASSKITYGNLVTNMSASLAPGLVLVKSQAVTGTAGSVVVTDAFSSAYDNYEIIYTGTALAGIDAQFTCQLGSATTNYRTTLVYCANNSTPLAASSSTQNALIWIGGGSSNDAYAHFKLFNPFLTRHTRMESNTYIAHPDAAFGHASGVHSANTSFTSFTLISTVGTFTGGTIRVYGYRN